MKTTIAKSVLAVAVLAATLTACSENQYESKIERKTVDGLPTVTATETARASAKVDAIDYDDRSIALTGPDGKTEIFYVTSAVRNFNQIKKGDTVKVEYYNQIFASVKKTGEPLSNHRIDAVALAPLGEKPGITCARHACIDTKVESIDLDSRVVKLRTLAGTLMVFTADKNLKNLDQVHVGDQVTFEYTEAVSITVD